MILEKIKSTYVLNWELVTIYSIYSLSILVPLVIGKPQLLVGSIVNFLIVYSTLRFGIKKTIPILFLPSITATTTGILFDGATFFLIYLTPFIIFSNILFSYFVSKKNIFGYILGILLKGIFLLLIYSILINTVGLPKIFLTSAYLQFVTAVIGFLLGYTLFQKTKILNIN